MTTNFSPGNVMYGVKGVNKPVSVVHIVTQTVVLLKSLTS